MSLVTPGSIRTLQRKLYLKAKQEPAYRFYALYDKLHRPDILMFAWQRVKANGGSPGIDGQSFAAIERGQGVEGFLRELRQELQDQTYRTQAVRRVMIPKADGSLRPLGIPTVRDRVVQMAAKLVLEPIFEADFCDTSYGFRPRRSAHNAMDAIAEGLRFGHTQVIDADLSKYFDSIPHAKLMATVAERIVDGTVLALLAQWLKAPIIEDHGDSQRGVGGGKGNRRGTPQGGVISPLLSNLYLHLLDRLWRKYRLDIRLGARLVRYADDFVVLCARGVDEPLNLIRRFLERLELTLNEQKTKIVDARAEEFQFLGYSVRMAEGRSGKRYPHIEPGATAIKRVKARLTELTDRRMTWKPLPDVVQEVNQLLNGWTGYYHYRNSSGVFARVKRHAEERLRIHLRKRHKIKDWGMGLHRFPNRVLYADYGLFKLPTTAGWTQRMP